MYRSADFRAAGIGFHPIAAGVHSGDGSWVAQRLVHQGLGVSYTVSGTAHDRRATGAFLIGPGEVIIQWPGMSHECTEHEGVPLQTIWVELDGPAVPRLARLFGATLDHPVVRPTRPEAAHAALHGLVASFQDDRLHHPAEFVAPLFHVAGLCAEGAAAGPSPRRTQEGLAERARRLLQTGMLSFPTVKQLAAELAVSQSTLLTACKRELGMSPIDLITEARLRKAKDLLRTTDAKLLHIAHACGFKSQSHFIRLFSRAEKLTPGVWRDRQPRPEAP